MEIQGPAADAMSNDEIVAMYGGETISKLIRSGRDEQYDSERQIRLNEARRNWLLVQGKHYQVPGDVDSIFGTITDYVEFGGDGTTDESGANVKLAPPVNFIGGDCWKFMSVMGQNAPAVKAVPDDPDNPDDIELARNADVNVRDIAAKIKIDRLWKSIAFHLYTTGPAFIRQYWNTDARKYGSTTEPKIEIQISAEGSPMPVQVGQEQYANGDSEMSVHSVLEVSVPWEATKIEECGKLTCERMLSKWLLISQFKGKGDEPGPLDKYRTSELPDNDMTGASTTAAETREAVSNPSGTGTGKKPGYWRFNEHWLQPHLYESIEEPEIRKIFQTQFPNGLYVARVGSITCKIEHESACDAWTVCKVGHEDKIMDRPLCSDSVPLQRVINDIYGMAVETVLRAIPITIADSQVIDRNAWNTKQAVAGELVLTAMPVDGDLAKRFYQIPQATLGQQVMPLGVNIRAAMQDIDGIRPELTGGGAPTNTYKEAKQRKDQAMLQLSPQADEMRFAAADSLSNAVKLRAKFGSGTVKIAQKGAYGMRTDVADIAQLKGTGWHTEADDNFPMTSADIHDGLLAMLELPPEVQQALSILDPMNIAQNFENLQLPGYESKQMDQVTKTLSDIKLLQSEQPIPGAPGPDGQPGPDTPSQPIDEYDNHVVAAGIKAAWLIAQQKVKHSNPAGFANVEASFKAQQLLTMPPMPPPIPPVKPSFAISLKAEDQPNIIGPLLAAAGVNIPAPVPPPAPGAPDMGTPAPIGGDQQVSPLPPLSGAGGPQAPAGPIQ